MLTLSHRPPRTPLPHTSRFFNSTFYLWTGWVVLLMVSFATASALHLGELSKTMDELQNRSHASDEVHAQEQVIYETYNSLVKITIAIFGEASVAVVLGARGMS